MTLYQFNGLDELEQYEVLSDKAVIVGDRTDGEYKIFLYQLFSFYAELYFHTEHGVNKRLRTFCNTECLDAYIQGFTLPDVTNTSL